MGWLQERLEPGGEGHEPAETEERDTREATDPAVSPDCLHPMQAGDIASHTRVFTNRQRDQQHRRRNDSVDAVDHEQGVDVVATERRAERQ